MSEGGSCKKRGWMRQLLGCPRQSPSLLGVPGHAPPENVEFSTIKNVSTLYYRKRGSASYIVRQWLLWVVERERERERRLWRHSISRWNREWSCIWLPRQRVDPTRRRVPEPVECSIACKDKELGAWALEQQGRVVMNDDREGKLCVRWSACRGSPSSISLACFKQEE